MAIPMLENAMHNRWPTISPPYAGKSICCHLCRVGDTLPYSPKFPYIRQVPFLVRLLQRPDCSDRPDVRSERWNRQSIALGVPYHVQWYTPRSTLIATPRLPCIDHQLLGQILTLLEDNRSWLSSRIGFALLLPKWLHVRIFGFFVLLVGERVWWLSLPPYQILDFNR